MSIKLQISSKIRDVMAKNADSGLIPHYYEIY